jgi:predicted O-methyltransferase YrrM
VTVPDLEALAGGERWKLADVEFVHSYRDESTANRFALRKPPDLVAKYRELCRVFAGANVVELGIAHGGSTALLALLARPRKLVAIELDDQRITALDELCESRGIGGSVRTYYGVDQSDRGPLAEIIDAEFGTEPLDLVIDDASHQYAETVTSFEVLYPRLRPGGLFVIEDWAADHARRKMTLAALDDTTSSLHAERQRRFTEALARRPSGLDPQPLHRIGPELMELTFAGTVVSELVVDRHWIAIRRGEASLDTDTFRLDDVRSRDWEWGLA